MLSRTLSVRLFCAGSRPVLFEDLLQPVLSVVRVVDIDSLAVPPVRIVDQRAAWVARVVGVPPGIARIVGERARRVVGEAARVTEIAGGRQREVGEGTARVAGVVVDMRRR